MSEGFGGLIDYYNDFVPRYFPLPGGKPRGRRSAQMIAKEFGLPVIRVKHVVLIDPVEAAERLRQIAAEARTTPKRGRPPKARAAE